MSGYVVKKLFVRFRYGRLSRVDLACTYSDLLQSFKVDVDLSQKLVNAKDRGGLWKVDQKILDVFFEFEITFRQKTASFLDSFHRQSFVNKFIESAASISRFHTVCLSAGVQVKKETRLNLLDHMLLLYTNVRMFSYAKDIKEKHKTSRKDSRKRALRTEMKKSEAAK